MFRRTPSRGGRGFRAAVDFVVCFECGGISLFFFRFLYFERTRPAASMRLPLASFTSLLVITQDRGSEATEFVFCLQAKKPLHAGVRTGLISLSVCLSVCLCNIRRFY